MPEISMFSPGCGRAVKRPEEPGAKRLPPANPVGRLLGGLAYASPLPAIVLLAIPRWRTNRFVGFHCWQSILFSVATVATGLLMRLVFAVLSIVPWVGFLFAWLSIGLVALAIVVLWAVLVVKAAQGDVYELPWLSRIASRLVQREEAIA
jgi:uncharacterized membrane protein